MGSRFYHRFLLSVLLAALVLSAAGEGDSEAASDTDAISTDHSISIANCIDTCYPGCKDACLGRGFKDGICFQNGYRYQCCCQ
ncbi:hypothetical protein VNO80_07124 [Phaseolus coccineus]|uniref:Uncharacterized protein n=1 Tax=Phaseolus coccineus TaxID=3886 RepID=A0AAN9NN15_PHACN